MRNNEERKWEEEMKQDFWDWWMLIDRAIPMSFHEGPMWCGMEMERDLRSILVSKMSGGREVSLLELRFMSEGRKGMRNNGESKKRKWSKISEIGEGWLMEWFQWVALKVHCDVEWKWGWRGIERGIWEGWGHWRHQGEWRSDQWNPKHMRDWMGRCGCEMMIECEVKSGQTGESIESPRFNWNKIVEFKTPKWWKGVKEEMNGGKSEKGEEGFEICETGENTLP